MNTAEISVNKLSINDYLKSGAKSKFLVPDYQRPYSWTADEITTLWDDIIAFFKEGGDTDYFCGTVVTYKNEKYKNEIIDGQQRTITLLLLLRAIYTTLEKSDRTDVKKLKEDIEECLWEVDRTSGEPDKDAVLIDLKVATDEHNQEFINILKTGKSKGLNHLSNGKISYLGATNRSNAVLSFVEEDGKLTQKGNYIAFIRNSEGSMGYSVYKSENFIATSDITVGYNEKLNRFSGMFITAISDRVRGKYTFNYKRSDTRLKNEILSLPKAADNTPDWLFMEQYMKRIENKVLEKVVQNEK